MGFPKYQFIQNFLEEIPRFEGSIPGSMYVWGMYLHLPYI